jgi:hypothetical protein
LAGCPLHAQVACGMHHVAVVASKVQAHGRVPEDGRRTRLLAWGRGAQGQLGCDPPKDYNLPQARAGAPEQGAVARGQDPGLLRCLPPAACPLHHHPHHPQHQRTRW